MKNLNISLAELQAKIEAGAEPYNLTSEQIAITHAFDSALRTSGIADQVVRPGFKFPSFVLKNQNRINVELEHLLARGPVVINFFRGVWCPYCNLELLALQEAFSNFEGAGASLVAISPQSSLFNKRTIQKNDLRFDILSDRGNALADKIGIKYRLGNELIEKVYKELGAELSTFNEDESWELPLASRFVLDVDGTIIASTANVDFRRRTDPEETLAVVRAITRRTSI